MRKLLAMVLVSGLMCAASASAAVIRVTGTAQPGMRVSFELEYQNQGRSTELVQYVGVNPEGFFEAKIPSALSQGQLTRIGLTMGLDEYEPARIDFLTTAGRDLPSAYDIGRIEVKPSQYDPHYNYLTPYVIARSGRELREREFSLPVDLADVELNLELLWRFPSR